MGVTLGERVRVFGQPGHVRRASVRTPWGITVACHQLIAERFSAACDDAYQSSSWVPKRIDSYNPRPIRGTENREHPSWSIHSWALAWDFFATGPNVPPPGGVWTPDNPPDAAFVAAFERHGFTWGGRWDRKDLPHFEWQGGLPTKALRKGFLMALSDQEQEDLKAKVDQLHDVFFKDTAWIDLRFTASENRMVGHLKTIRTGTLKKLGEWLGKTYEPPKE